MCRLAPGGGTARTNVDDRPELQGKAVASGPPGAHTCAPCWTGAQWTGAPGLSHVQGSQNFSVVSTPPLMGCFHNTTRLLRKADNLEA
ncbi:hypothetical protein MC885_020880 [Smutsia gigantea]|nr:hypothetical protein MC885_020880 [Smutsia gigantea]